MQSETDVDVSVIQSGEDDGGVPHGRALMAFVDAAIMFDPVVMGEARGALVEAAGRRR